MSARLAVFEVQIVAVVRGPLLSSLIAIGTLLSAGLAQAGVLTSAEWTQVVEGFPMTRTMAQLGATGTSTSDSISVQLVYPYYATDVLRFRDCCSPSPFNWDRFTHLTQGGSQALTAMRSVANADQGIPGTFLFRTAAHNEKGVNQSKYTAGHTIARIPLNVGVNGQYTATSSFLGLSHQITVDFYGWTPRRRVFTGLTEKGVALPDVVAQGSFDLTSLGGGTVTLVSPTKISADGSLSQRRTASFTKLKLIFAPPPRQGGGWGCGVGPELALLLPPFLWMRIRRTRCSSYASGARGH